MEWLDYPSVDDKPEEELPEAIEEWNAWWFLHTYSKEDWAQWAQFEEDHLGVTKDAA